MQTPLSKYSFKTINIYSAHTSAACNLDSAKLGSFSSFIVIPSCFLWGSELAVPQFPLIEIVPTFSEKLAFNITNQ